MDHASTRQASTHHAARVLPIALLLVALVGCSTQEATLSPAPTSATAPPASSEAAASPTGPAPVVIDTDLSGDDTMALPFLLREPGIEVAAITVAGTGLVHCAQGLEHVMALLTTLQAGDLPVSCGRSKPLAGSHAFPDAWRARADAGFGLSLDQRPASASSQPAAELIASTAASSTQPITIIELSPMTNLGEAFQADPTLPDHVARIVAMGGAIDATGNVDLGSGPTAAEWNVYADPTAAGIVVDSGVPITLVPLDATNDVPVNADFIDRLAADHTAAPADIAYELLVRGALTTADSFWDPLAAVVAVDDPVVDLQTIPLRVVTDEGPDSGRLVRADDGVPVRVAMSADQGAFEDRFLSGLRVGVPRAHPFQLSGTMKLRFDGDACVDERPEAPTGGVWQIEAQSTAAGMSGFAVVRFHEGYGWSDLLDYVATATDYSQPPSFLDLAAISNMDAAGSMIMTADLEPGRYGMVCLSGTNNAPRVFPASGLFTVGE